MQRRHDLDWVRILAFALLVPYHVGMYYVSWDWHVKSPAAGETLEPLMLLTAPWRLALLFLVSGAASAFLFARRPAGFLGERTRRLLVPLLFGMAVLVVPQAYYEVVEQLPGGTAEALAVEDRLDAVEHVAVKRPVAAEDRRHDHLRRLVLARQRCVFGAVREVPLHRPVRRVGLDQPPDLVAVVDDVVEHHWRARQRHLPDVRTGRCLCHELS